MKLKHGSLYKNKYTNLVLELRKDYNGRWYLFRRDEKGVSKTISCSTNEMMDVLSEHYERSK